MKFTVNWKLYLSDTTYKAGDQVDLSEEDAKQLVRLGVLTAIEPVAVHPPTKAKK